jgi:hypothetical protein
MMQTIYLYAAMLAALCEASIATVRTTSLKLTKHDANHRTGLGAGTPSAAAREAAGPRRRQQVLRQRRLPPQGPDQGLPHRCRGEVWPAAAGLPGDMHRDLPHAQVSRGKLLHDREVAAAGRCGVFAEWRRVLDGAFVEGSLTYILTSNGMVLRGFIVSQLRRMFANSPTTEN